jgi:WD40 repeat protein
VTVASLRRATPPRQLFQQYAPGPGLDFRFLPGMDDLVAAEPGSPTLTVYDLEPDGDIQRDRQIPRPDVPFDSMAVDPSGRSVAVASLAGRRVDVLDLTTGGSRATLNMPSPGQPEFSRDGHLAIAGGDNLIRIYDTTSYTQLSLDTDASIRFARSLVTRPLTSDECTRYFPHEHCPTFAP